jgi:hypothetical protein
MVRPPTHHHCNHLAGANEMLAEHEKKCSLLPQVESEFQSPAAMRGWAKGETLVAGYCRKTALVGAIGFEPSPTRTTKNLPDSGGNQRTATERNGTAIGRKLDVRTEEERRTMATPKTTQELLRELELLRDDSYTLSQRHRRLLDAAKQIIDKPLAGPKVTAKPDEAMKT